MIEIDVRQIDRLLHQVTPDLADCELRFRLGKHNDRLAEYLPCDDAGTCTIVFSASNPGQLRDFGAFLAAGVHELGHWVCMPDRAAALAHRDRGFHDLAWTRVCCHLTHRFHFAGRWLDPRDVGFVGDDYECCGEAGEYLAATRAEALQLRQYRMRDVLSVDPPVGLVELWVRDFGPKLVDRAEQAGVIR